MHYTLLRRVVLRRSFSNLFLLRVLEYKTCYGIQQFVQCNYVHKSNASIVLFDKQKNHQAMNRLAHIFVFHSVNDTTCTLCVQLFDAVLLTETYAQHNITAVKILPHEFIVGRCWYSDQ